jgi:hypothetical protein
MSVYEGRRAAEAIEEFNRSQIDQRLVPDGIGRTLLQRPLGDVHFKQLSEHLRALREIPGLIIAHDYTQSVPNDHRLGRFVSDVLAYMAPLVAQKATYVPVVSATEALRNKFSFSVRIAPVALASEHIERRYVDSSTKPIEYASEDFSKTLAIGTLLTMQLDAAMRPVRQKGGLVSQFMPVALPARDGLLLGYLAPIAPETYYPSTKVTAEHIGRGSNDNHYAITGLRTTSGAVATRDSPLESILVMNTYLYKGKFSPVQKILRERYQAVMDSIDQPLLNLFYNEYSRGMLGVSQASNRHLGPIAASVGQILISQEWEREVAAAMPSMMNNIQSGGLERVFGPPTIPTKH